MQRLGLPIFAAMLLALSCGGCTLSGVHDLSLSSVGPVDYRDPPVAIPMRGDEPEELLLEIKFSTQSDLSKIDDALTIKVEWSFCERPDVRARLGSRSVYWRDW